MSLLDIRSSIEKLIEPWSINNSIDLAWENVRYDPNGNRDFARCYLLPAKTDSLFLEGGDRRYVGNYYVNLFVKEGTGNARIDSLIATLEDTFYAGRRLIFNNGIDYLIITEPINSAQRVNDNPPYFMVSSRFEYNCHIIRG